MNNANNTSQGAPHTIIVAAGPSTLNITSFQQGEDAARVGDLDITATMSILGAGAASMIADAGPAPILADRGRVFDIRAGTTTISSLTVRHGSLGSGQGPGCGIRVLEGATANLLDMQVSQNGANDNGGGIRSEGYLDLPRFTIRGNPRGGVVIAHPEGTGVLANVNISDGQGGGIRNQGSLTLSRSRVNASVVGAA